MDSNNLWWPVPVEAPDGPSVEARDGASAWTPTNATKPSPVRSQPDQSWPTLAAPESSSRKSKPRGRLGGLLAAIAAFLAKLKSIILLLPKLKLCR